MALIQSHYCMNVARDTGRAAWDGGRSYSHFCAIELGACSSDIAKEKARDIAERFPAPEFHVTLTRVECGGRDIDFT